MKSGIELIAKERQRQIEAEGWTPEHDDQHVHGELADAAACYVDGNPVGWPWDEKWWKPSSDPIRNLAKAGALIAAEIDRLQRLPNAGGQSREAYSAPLCSPPNPKP